MSFIAPVLPREVYGEANIRLGKIEMLENVTIVFAVESGSRAWGFPSPDSDNDVRFFFVRPLSHYVGLTDMPDVINQPIDGPWDLSGWDLRKALQLLLKGNATVGEWLSSPLIYREHGPLPYRLRDLIKRHATPESSARHYYGLAKSCYEREINSRPTVAQVEALTQGTLIKGVVEVNYKKYLYAIRAACAISWISSYHEIPPMTLPALLSHDIIPAGARQRITDLLARKATMGEFGVGNRIVEIDDFIEKEIAWVKSSGFDKIEASEEFAEEADQLLLDALGIG
jgi:predicted nucleotidyltransferase